MGCILSDVMKPADIRGLYEEIANSVSHAIGLGLAAGAVSYLVHDTLSYEDPLRFVSAVVYGLSILLMFVSSTLYHGYQLQPLKHYLRVFDHITIYLMIGGTLTPFILSHARNPLGYSAPPRWGELIDLHSFNKVGAGSLMKSLILIHFDLHRLNSLNNNFDRKSFKSHLFLFHLCSRAKTTFLGNIRWER